MLVPYESFLSSEIFRLQGPQGKFFYVHGGLLSKRSEGLAVHVNGGMLEAKSKEIVIQAVDDDVDDDTVMKFVEYAYTGDYTLPKPDVLLTAIDIGPQIREGDIDGNPDTSDIIGHLEAQLCGSKAEIADNFESSFFADWSKPVHRKKKGLKKKFPENSWCIDVEESSLSVSSKADPDESRRSVLWGLFCGKACWIPVAKQWYPQARSHSNEDFTNVLLCHARLYVFSSRWHCEDLRDLVLHKLRLTLSKHTVGAENRSEIVRLIDYTYAHTQDYAHGGIDRLRDLVIDFVVCHIESIEPDQDFRTMLTGSNEVGRDLIRKLIKRLD